MTKRRLAHVLRPAERMDLMRRLFDHVSGVLSSAGLDVIPLMDESPAGLNGVVSEGLDRWGVPALVVHADLPLLTVDDVWTVLSVPGDVVIARAFDGGTNGLLLRAPLEPAFGVGSAIAHAARARSAGLVARVIDVPGFAQDIDDAASLTSFGGAFLRPRL